MTPEEQVNSVIRKAYLPFKKYDEDEFLKMVDFGLDKVISLMDHLLY